MIRNRRADTGIEWTKRKVETIIIDVSKTEQALYDAVSLFKSTIQKSQIAHSFQALTFQREACSSREAVYHTLKNMKEKYENPSP